jgi:hypothetical protein
MKLVAEPQDDADHLTPDEVRLRLFQRTGFREINLIPKAAPSTSSSDESAAAATLVKLELTLGSKGMTPTGTTSESKACRTVATGASL